MAQRRSSTLCALYPSHPFRAGHVQIILTQKVVCAGTRALVGEERHLPTHGTIVYVPLIDLNKQMGSVEFAFGTVSPNTDIAAEKDPLSEAAKS